MKVSLLSLVAVVALGGAAALAACDDDPGEAGPPVGVGGGGSGGTGASTSDGGVGGGGGGAGPAPETFYYALWSLDSAARIVKIDRDDGAVVDQADVSLPASRGTGWGARDLDVLRDGTRRLLWTRAEQGQALVWILDADLALLDEIEYQASDPAAGWFATSFAPLADETGRLVWFNLGASSSGAVAWTLDAEGQPVQNGLQRTYNSPASTGTEAVWVPTSYSPAPDGTARILWANTSGSGEAVVWHMDPAENQVVPRPVTAAQSSFARAYVVEDDMRVRMAWGDDANGSASVCTFARDADVGVVDSAGQEGWGDGECLHYEAPDDSWVFRTLALERCAPGYCPDPCVDDLKLAHMMAPPATLAETGPFSDPRVTKDYQPAFVLWSDGAQKQRRIYIPKCAVVDTRDMDHWELPVGTRVWKEFRRDSVHVETRVIHRFGPGPDDWMFAPYQINDTATLGDWVPDGVQNARGTQHDIPNEAACRNCHTKLSERLLSFSAIQLSHALPGETLETLAAAGKLSVAPDPAGYVPPGNADERTALGYLHANCGNCHNDTGVSPLRMRLLVAHTTVESTDAYTTGIDQPTTTFNCNGGGVGTCDRIEPGNPDLSAIVMRISVRTPGVQMPPIGTELVDDAGVNAIRSWISGL